MINFTHVRSRKYLQLSRTRFWLVRSSTYVQLVIALSVSKEGLTILLNFDFSFEYLLTYTYQDSR